MREPLRILESAFVTGAPCLMLTQMLLEASSTFFNIFNAAMIDVYEALYLVWKASMAFCLTQTAPLNKIHMLFLFSLIV